jgi:hypothetical protein
MLVFAITAALAVIVFIGQRQLLGRARFDAAIDKMIQDAAFSKQYATSYVNEYGQGNSTDTEFAGVAYEFDNNHPVGHLTEMEPIYARYDNAGNFQQYTDLPSNPGSSCPDMADGECFEHYFNTPTDFKLTNATIGEIAFINKGNVLQVCAIIGGSFGSVDEMCDPASNPNLGHTIDYNIQDSSGFKATLRLDPQTGTLKRL